MVLFNYSTKEITAKIVYYGPGLCGKTTNLQFVYDNLPQAINKGKMLSLATKTDRTLFFDFLPIDLGTIRGMRTRLQLYTVPGQVFYNTTRKLVLKGADGVVFVADSQRRMIDANLESFRNLEENLAEHDMKLAEMPLIVQFNKRDLPDVAGVEELNAALNKYNAPIYEAVATTGIGVHETLKAITRLVLNSLKERYADKREQRAEPAPGVAAAAMAAAQARAQTGAPAGWPAPAPSPRSQAASAPPPAAARPDPPPAPQEEPFDIAAPEEMPTLDFAMPQTAHAAIEAPAPGVKETSPFEPAPTSPFDESPVEEPFAIEEEPLEWPAGPPEAAADVLPRETAGARMPGPFGQEDALELETAGEDVLELVEEEPEAAAASSEPVADEAPQLLDVTEELLPADEPFALDAGPDEIAGAAPVMPAGAVVDDFDAMEVDLQETPEPTSVTASAKMAAFFDAALPVGDPRSIVPAAGVTEESALVVEDRQEDPFGWSERGADTGAAIPIVREGPASPAIDQRSPDSRETPMIPFAAMTPPAERPAVVREVSASELLAREIHLPIRLEIGGQSISFDLKISLDLAAGGRPGGGSPS